MTELDEIKAFASAGMITDHLPEMEAKLDLVIGYAQRVGELVNEAEEAFSLAQKEALDRFAHNEEETETTRKAKIVAHTATLKRELADLKNLFRTLRARQMSLLQAIKTRRETP